MLKATAAIAADKRDITADDTDLSADGDPAGGVILLRFLGRELSFLDISSLLSLPPSKKLALKSIPISADAYVTRMKWGDWAKILSSASPIPFVYCI